MSLMHVRVVSSLGVAALLLSTACSKKNQPSPPADGMYVVEIACDAADSWVTVAPLSAFDQDKL